MSDKGVHANGTYQRQAWAGLFAQPPGKAVPASFLAQPQERAHLGFPAKPHTPCRDLGPRTNQRPSPHCTLTSAVLAVASIRPCALFGLISGLLGPSGITTASKCAFPIGHEKAEMFQKTLFSQGLTTESGWACGKSKAVNPGITTTSKLSSPSLHIPRFIAQRGRDAHEHTAHGNRAHPTRSPACL